MTKPIARCLIPKPQAKSIPHPLPMLTTHPMLSYLFPQSSCHFPVGAKRHSSHSQAPSKTLPTTFHRLENQSTNRQTKREQGKSVMQRREKSIITHDVDNSSTPVGSSMPQTPRFKSQKNPHRKKQHRTNAQLNSKPKSPSRH